MDVKVFDVYFLFCDCGTCECPWGSPGSQRVFCGLNPWVCLRSGCFWTASRSSKFYLHGESVQTDVAADCQSTPLRKTKNISTNDFLFRQKMDNLDELIWKLIMSIQIISNALFVFTSAVAVLRHSGGAVSLSGHLRTKKSCRTRASCVSRLFVLHQSTFHFLKSLKVTWRT